MKSKRLLVSLLAVIGLLLSCFIGASAVGESESDLWTDYAAGSFSSGSGTREDPYRIGSAGELALLAKLTNQEDKNYNAAYYKLTADIDLSGHCWFPIGALKENENGWDGFSGVFDGGGYTISNMQITRDFEEIYQYGLFGMNCGSVRNLTLKNPVIAFDSTQSGWQASNGMGSDFVIGAVAGKCGARKLNIENCIVENVNIDVISAMSIDCGGLTGGLNYGMIQNARVSGTVSAKAARAIEIGGAIGNVSNETYIKGCSFSGAVISESSGFIGDEALESQGYSYLHYAGGFCGDAGRANGNVNIENCYAVGTVSSKSEKGDQDVGGFAGAVGIIHRNAVYKNLYCKVVVTADRAGKVAKEQDFWQGEWPFGNQSDCDTWEYTNCVNVYDNFIEVANTNVSPKYVSKKKYSVTDNKIEGPVVITINDSGRISATYLEFFKDILKFDEAYWSFRENDLPLLKEDGKHEHYFTSSVTREPTCQQEGVTTYSCVCGESYTEAIGKIDHTFGEWEWLTKPTYTSEGCMAATCTMCNTETDTKFIPPLETTEVSALTVSNISSQVYTGKAITPAVTVKDGKKTLTAGTHYTVTYQNNTKIGTASLTIKGVKENGYKGSKTLSFTILPGVTSGLTTEVSSSSAVLSWKAVPGATGYRVYYYNPSTKKYTALKTTTATSYTVTKLEIGTSYKFAVKAYATANGKTYWSAGYKTVTATALPGVTGKVSTQTSSSAVKLSWKAVPGATGYRVYYYNPSTKKYTALKTTTATSYTVTKLKSGTSYEFAVKAYTTANGKTYWSAGYKTVTATTNPGKPTLTVTAGSKKAELSWNEQTGATGYVVYMATAKDGKYSKIATLQGNTKVSYTKAGLTKGATYYFKVAAYTTVSGKTIYSSFSSIKSVKAK